MRAGVRTAHPVSTVHHSYHLSPTCSPAVVYTQLPSPNEVRSGRAGKNFSEFLSGTNKNKAKPHDTSKPEERKVFYYSTEVLISPQPDPTEKNN